MILIMIVYHSNRPCSRLLWHEKHIYFIYLAIYLASKQYSTIPLPLASASRFRGAKAVLLFFFFPFFSLPFPWRLLAPARGPCTAGKVGRAGC